METVLVSLFTVVLLVVSVLTMVTTSLKSVNMISDSFQAIEKQAVNIQLTSIDLSFKQVQGDLMILNVQNRGQTDLQDYSDWNVLVQPEEGQAISLVHCAGQSIAANQWKVDSFWMTDGVPEVFDLAILNPGEIMTISLNLLPQIQPLQKFRITVATPNGITAQCQLIIPPVE
jgi:hypothetical protein